MAVTHFGGQAMRLRHVSAKFLGFGQDALKQRHKSSE
jgi:hypothetical protein